MNPPPSKNYLVGICIQKQPTLSISETGSHVVVRPNIPAIKVIHKVNATTENSVSLPFSTGKMLACY